MTTVEVEDPTRNLANNPEDRSTRQHAKALTAGLVGNILEWYDFAIYGFFAATIGRKFFPAEDPATSLIASFGTFAAGFLMRPVGAVVFGYVGDLVGRKRALMISIMMMAVPTFLVGIMPTYEHIGLAAAALLVVLRMIQGISVGGEYTGSIVFLVEHAPEGRRGFFGSFSVVGAVGGTLLGSAVGASITALTTDEHLVSWGWRLPFITGILLGFVGMWVRRGIPELPVAPEKSGSPLVDAFTQHWGRLIQAAGLNLMSAVTFYIVFVYMTTWLVQEVHETRAEALEINTISMVALMLVLPLAAVGSDRFGRKPFLIGCTAGMVLLSYPLLWLMHHHNFAMILLGQLGFAVLVGGCVGVIPVTIAELFPRKLRVSATSVSYNLPVAIFGGTAPLVASWLVATTENAMSISWYLIVTALLSFITALTLPESHKNNIHA